MCSEYKISPNLEGAPTPRRTRPVHVLYSDAMVSSVNRSERAPCTCTKLRRVNCKWSWQMGSYAYLLQAGELFARTRHPSSTRGALGATDNFSSAGLLSTSISPRSLPTILTGKARHSKDARIVGSPRMFLLWSLPINSSLDEAPEACVSTQNPVYWQ
ncbi:hypothetical protein BDV96DRAFT_586604 [Lophiotrema nucula]|uniref:Uncharacterized protein n=1 Tax=Lophiotrema nucula TaxID=690887 RepID=A0A6A5YSS1_9PLEO|nr:hypothetical protein BDV96DRAFT_586604 [Lophiotrema nucula]